MDRDKKICRLCLQIIGKDVPYCMLTNNKVVLQHLNLISINTVKNLDLVEDSIICNSCDNKLKELAKFKETIIGNEFKIQCNQKADVNIYLQSLSDNIEEICRLCLKSSEKEDELQESWHDQENLFLQCNIHMNINISVPAKMCRGCCIALQTMADFILQCSENEALILDRSAEYGKLTARDLLKIYVEKSSTRSNNNVRMNESKVEETCQKRSSDKKFDGQVKKGNKGKTKLAKIKTEEEVFDINRTPNTYRSKKTSSKKSKPLPSAEMPSTSRAQFLTNNATDREYALERMNQEIRKMHISIDASPVQDLADITLLVDEEGMVQEEATSEYNATQELIDVLEGRLNDQNINYATQELLDVLEGRSEDDIQNMVVTVEIEPKSKKGKGGKRPKIAGARLAEKNVVNEASTSSANGKQVKIIEVVTIQGKKELKRTRAAEPSNVKPENKRQGLRQKTYSKEKPSKNKEVEPPEGTGATESSDTIKRSIKKSSSITNRSEQSVKKAIEAGKKKTPEASDGTSPLKRQMRKAAPKLEMTETNISSDDDDDDDAVVIANEDSEDEDLAEDMQKNFENRPVTVTIIKSKRRTNKAQLEKTWQELTGNPLPSASTVNGNEMQGGLEIEVVKRKRGRPRLPEGQKKMKKIKKEVIWMHCDSCPFKTYAHNSFIQHQLIHNIMSTIPLLHCDVCRFTTTNADLMSQHKVSHEAPNLNYKCVFCDGVFKKKVSCMYHTLRHDDQDVASQFYCMVYNGVTEEEYFECYQCDYQNVEESPMPDHVIDHTIEKPKNPIVAKFKCNQCPYRTKSEDLLKRHKMMHVEKDRKKKSKSVVKTEPETAIKEELEGDNSQDNEEDLFPLLKCDQCHYVTRNKRSLANHKGLKHNRQFTPAEAGAIAAAKAAAEDLPMYYCNECSYSTHRKLNMPRHALVHRTKENMELFECPHCLFETKHRRSYTRHLEAVHGVVA